MRFLVLIAAMLPSASISAAPDVKAQAPFRTRVFNPYAAAPATCRTPMRQAGGVQLQGRKLGELPAGDLHLTVVREVDGCPEPTVVRQGYGAAAQTGGRSVERK